MHSAILLRALPLCALLAVGALAVWRYQVYRHHVTLAPTDTVVLADIDNQTSDPVFDDALNNGLRYELEQTPYLNLLALDKTYNTLGNYGFLQTPRPRWRSRVRFVVRTTARW